MGAKSRGGRAQQHLWGAAPACGGKVHLPLIDEGWWIVSSTKQFGTRFLRARRGCTGMTDDLERERGERGARPRRRGPCNAPQDPRVPLRTAGERSE